MYNLLDSYFNTNINYTKYWTNWITTTFIYIKRKNLNKILLKVLETIFNKLQLIQKALKKGYQKKLNLYITVIRAYNGIPKLEYALFQNVKLTCKALFANLQAFL